MRLRVNTTGWRRGVITLCVAALVLVVNQPALASLAQEAPPAHQGGLRIVAFGDSLTAGLGVSADEAYPAQLQRRLTALGLPHHVVNAGVSGETTAGGVRRVPWLLKSQPDLVILELGANDGLRGLRVDATRANLEQMIRLIQESGARVILVGMKLPPNYGQAYIAAFERIFTDLATQYRIPFVPFFLDGVAGSAKLNQADGIHPTAEGYRHIVDHLLPTLLPILNGNETASGGGKRKTPASLTPQPGRSP